MQRMNEVEVWSAGQTDIVPLGGQYVLHSTQTGAVAIANRSAVEVWCTLERSLALGDDGHSLPRVGHWSSGDPLTDRSPGSGLASRGAPLVQALHFP